jgi:hypothetical protein
MGWARHVAGMEEKSNGYRVFQWDILKERA